MKAPALDTKAAQKVYSGYIRRVKRAVSKLPQADREEVLMEINSHIYEGLQRGEGGDEVNTLLDTLERLGEPEEFLQPMVADRKLKQATTTFNPLHVAQALALNIGRGVLYLVFAILYLTLAVFGFVIYSEITDPEHTGLFLQDGQFMALGVVSDASGKEEILGNWLIPACIVVAVLMYLIITLLMRLIKRE